MGRPDYDHFSHSNRLANIGYRIGEYKLYRDNPFAAAITQTLLQKAYNDLIEEVTICLLLLKQSEKRFKLRSPSKNLITQIKSDYIPSCHNYAREIKDIIEC